MYQNEHPLSDAPIGPSQRGRGVVAVRGVCAASSSDLAAEGPTSTFRTLTNFRWNDSPAPRGVSAWARAWRRTW
jgi:hypothetical protein